MFMKMNPFQNNEQIIQIILDSIPAWVFFKDKENRFIRVNKTFCDIMEMSKKQLEGKSVFDFFPREQAEAYWDDDKKVMASGKPVRNIIEPMDSKHGKLWVRTDKIPYRNPEGEIIGIIGFSIEITELKKAETDLKNLHANEVLIRKELEQTLKQLQDSFVKIKELQSILPMCSYCRNIRDDKGHWSHLESYITKHTKSNFSHGICPDCLKKHFPEHAKK